MAKIIVLDRVPEQGWMKETITKERESDPNTFIFFKHEWDERSEQISAHVESYSGEKRKVHARKCEVREIGSAAHREFCELYHIQGSNKLSMVAFGIFLGEEMLGVLSLGRHNRDSRVTVLDRMCFKAGCRVVGGASKLFSRAKEWALERGICSIVSFSDERMSTGAIYERLGFSLECVLLPDYLYVKEDDLGVCFSKQSQCKRATGCPMSVTEKEWAKRSGLVQVFDAGKKRWVYKLRIDKQVPLKSRRQGYYETKKANPRTLYYQSSYELRAATILDEMEGVQSYINQHTFAVDGRDRITDFVVSWLDGTKSILEIKPERRLDEFRSQLDDNREYAQRNGWKFEVWTEKELGFESEYFATKWADEFISKITQVDFVKERKGRNLSKAKKFYDTNIATDKVSVFCEYCQVTHEALRLTHDKNIARNGRYICEREGGHLVGSRPKPHLRKENPHAAEGKKECLGCKQVLCFSEYGADKARSDGYASKCKECRRVAANEKYAKKKASSSNGGEA